MNTTRLPDGDIQLGDYKFRIDPDYVNVVYIISRGCNFRCTYCGAWDEKECYNLLDDHSLVDVAQSFHGLRTQTGKKLYITFTGGEPSLVKGFVELAVMLTNTGNYIELQTNLTTEMIQQFAEHVRPDRVGQVMATYHEETLSRNPHLRELYFQNFKLLADKGFTVVLKTVALPWEIPLLKDKLAGLRSELPQGAPILVQPYINHGSSPHELITSYPYIYTDSEKQVMQDVMTYRRGEITDYINGAGQFHGMQCAAGSGFIVVNNHGDAYRCSPYMTHKSHKLGNLMRHDIRLLESPEPCPVLHCSTSFWPLWYGVSPWKYTGRSEQDSRYCRFAGVPVPNGNNKCDQDVLALDYLHWAFNAVGLGDRRATIRYLSHAVMLSPAKVMAECAGKVSRRLFRG